MCPAHFQLDLRRESPPDTETHVRGKWKRREIKSGGILKVVIQDYHMKEGMTQTAPGQNN